MNFLDRQYNVFHLFNDRWALAAAGTIDNYNCMTISWGSMGTLWGPPHQGKPVLTIYVSPARHTHGYLETNEFFTVSFFPEAYRKELMLLGSKSGRDVDKIALADLTPVELASNIGFAEAETTFVCRKLYAHTFVKEQTPQEIREGMYGRIPPHTMYIGEIVEAIGG